MASASAPPLADARQRERDALPTLSRRGARAIAPALSYGAYMGEGSARLHDPVTRPDGYVLMAIAENRLTFHLAQEK
ncbi:hypothetical protein EON62_00605, partial [archaeon]